MSSSRKRRPQSPKPTSEPKPQAAQIQPPTPPLAETTSPASQPSVPSPEAEVELNAPQPPSPFSQLPDIQPTPEASIPDLAALPPVTRQHPIPPPSEPRQYRAIGLVRGQYSPSAEQFTQGTLLTTDGTVLKAVLLGRVMSLVKKYLSQQQNYLWVVYPRINEKSPEPELMVQIVGVWEPELLHKTEPVTTAPSPDAATASPEISTPPTSPSADSALEPTDGYFSIRGQVVFQSAEGKDIIVKIQQAPRKSNEPEKAFKLKLIGALPTRAVGCFWDLDVQRQGNDLVIQRGSSLGLLPPKKKTPGATARRGAGSSKPWTQRRSPPDSDATSASRRTPLPKPVKRADTSPPEPKPFRRFPLNP